MAGGIVPTKSSTTAIDDRISSAIGNRNPRLHPKFDERAGDFTRFL
jgi:hypothetical protein